MGNRYNDKNAIKVYNMDDTMHKLVNEAYHNLDTEKGYKAYYALNKYIRDNHKDDSILYDLGVEFDWDDKLEIAVAKLARSEHRFDLINTNEPSASKLIGYAIKIELNDGTVYYKLKDFTENYTEDYLYTNDVSNRVFKEEYDAAYECAMLNGCGKAITETIPGTGNFRCEPFPVYIIG